MGDERLAQLVEDRGPNLIAYAYLLTGGDASAHDVVQEALIRTFSRRRAGADVEWLEAYVRQAILHVFLDTYRSRRRWSLRAPMLADRGHPPDGPDVTAVRRADIRAALASLPPQQARRGWSDVLWSRNGHVLPGPLAEQGWSDALTLPTTPGAPLTSKNADGFCGEH